MNIFDLKYSRKDIAKNLASMTLIRDTESEVSIDSDLLFQRLLVSASNLVDIHIQDIFPFELFAYAPALFESVDLPNKVDKPPLAKAIRKEVHKNAYIEQEISTH